MGASFSKTDIDNIYRNQNELVNKASQDCVASLKIGIDNVHLTFENTKVGDIEFAQQAVVDPVCVFDSNVSLVAENIIEQLSEVENNDTGLLPFHPLGWGINLTDITNQVELENIIRNNIQQNCNFTADAEISNVTLTFAESKAGDVIFQQEGNIQGQCMLTNLAALQTQANVMQNNDVDNGKVRNLSTIIITIVIIIAVVIVFVALLGAIRGKKNKGDETDICAELKGEEKATCELQKFENKAPTGGIPPEVYSGAYYTPYVNQ